MSEEMWLVVTEAFKSKVLKFNNFDDANRIYKEKKLKVSKYEKVYLCLVNAYSYLDVKEKVF